MIATIEPTPLDLRSNVFKAFSRPRLRRTHRDQLEGQLASIQQSSQTEFSVNRRWLLAAQISALLTVVVMVVPVTVTAIIGSFSQGPKHLLDTVYLAFFWLPHLWVFWRLSGKTEQSIRRGLGLAVSFGSFILLLSLFLPEIFASWRYAEPILLPLLQFTLVVSAIKIYYFLRREPRERALLADIALGLVLFLLIHAAVVLPNVAGSRQLANEASAVGSLHTLNTAEASYAEKYPDKGFAQALTDLAPPQNNFIEVQSAGGQKSHYLFTLAAAPADSHGHISAYSITACPQSFASDGRRCFFTDQTRVIRYTRRRIPRSTSTIHLESVRLNHMVEENSLGSRNVFPKDFTFGRTAMWAYGAI
jgi:hypothetical protein